MIEIDHWHGNTMPNNDWWSHVMPHSSQARIKNGLHRYRLVVQNVNPGYPGLVSAFKIRANGTVKMLSDYPFGFASSRRTTADLYIIYPGYVNLSNPGSRTTYDGKWVFYLYLPRPASYLEFWDADLDYYGEVGGPNQETDDPNTPNDILPPWAIGTNPLYEGVNPGVPQDDFNHIINRRSPPVRYEIIDPVGRVYTNENPSGTQEWELFRIDTAPYDPAIMDHHAESLPAGIYTLIIEGLDVHNFGVWKFFNDLIGSDVKGRVIVPPDAICSIGDYIWNDHNRNGLPDDGESPIPGVRVLLYNQLGEIIATVNTDEEGKYLFKNVPPVHVTVRVDSTTLPSGFVVTTGQNIFQMTLEPANHPRDLDFGYAADFEPSCGKPVFAWYEAWYASAQNDSSLRYWDFDKRGGIIDTAAFDLFGEYAGINSSQRPDLYDATDPHIWEYHILQAWAAEIDAFVVDWYGKESYEHSPTRGLLNAAQRLFEKYAHAGFDFRIIVSLNEKAHGDLGENLRFIADSLLTHPAYYNGREGLARGDWTDIPRPLFVFSPYKHLDPNLFHQLRQTNLPEDVQTIWNWDGRDMALKGMVQSVYPWVQEFNTDSETGKEWGKNYLESFYASAELLEIDFVTGAAWPGFDDRNWSQGQNRWIDRQNSEVYSHTWQLAFSYQPKWILVQSWNDFNRSTHIHSSKLYRDLYLEKTRQEAIRWKGGAPCARDLSREAWSIPEGYFNGQKRPLRQSVLDEALKAFFARDYLQAKEILAMKGASSLTNGNISKPGNALVFVKGTSTYCNEGWAHAVDGILQGWGGTVTTRPQGDSDGNAWAIFRFADPGLFAFDYITLQTDNGTDDDPFAERQAQKIQVLVSKEDMRDADFTPVATINIRAGGQMEWYPLGTTAIARYVKLVILEPKYTSGGWRQIVEFDVQCRDRQGAKPASEGLTLAQVPASFALEQNYPNPFNPVTTIFYQLPQQAHVTLKIYNIQGRKVAELVQSEQAAGRYQVTWNARNMAGGIYFLRLRAGAFEAVRKMSLMK